MHPLLAALEWENVHRPALWVALAMAAAVVLWSTYRGIFQRTGRSLAWGLLALRASGVAIVLLLLSRPIWKRDTVETDPARLAVVLDDSASMSLPDASGQSRYALARQAVASLQSAAAEDPTLRLELFDIQGRPLAEPEETPRGERTDLVRAVSTAAGRLRARAISGVVLISDGVDNTGRPDLSDLAESPFPIYTIGFREDAGSAQLDLALPRATAPTRAMIHNEVEVALHVRKTAGPAIEANVTIARGQEILLSQPVALEAGDSEQIVPLRFTPHEAGRFVFAASISTPAGERLLTNNAQHFPLEVEAAPIRVLYVEGFLRDEFKFLKARLEDDPDVSLATVVRRGNQSPEEPQTSQGEVLSAQRLTGYDVVILGDLEGSFFTPLEYQTLLQWLDGDQAQPAAAQPSDAPEQNAQNPEAPAQPGAANPAPPVPARTRALLVLGGYQSLGPAGWGTTPLAAALPVEMAAEEPFQTEEPFTLHVTAAGARHPMFKITGDPVQDAQLWSAAPPLLGAGVVRAAKPGAEILATNPGLVLQNEPAVVVAAQRFGAGRVMLITADTTWRWSRLARIAGQADTLYPRFWSQTIRWLSGREGEVERPPLVVSTDHPSYEVRRPVQVRVVRQPRAGEELSDGELTVAIQSDAGRTWPVEVRSSSAAPHTFSGTFYPEAGGRYVVTAALSSAGQTQANQAAEFLVHGSDLELANPGVNRPLLQSLAQMTGGTLLDIDQLADLPGQLPRKERRIYTATRADLGSDYPWLFTLFLGLIASEWFLRRRHQMV